MIEVSPYGKLSIQKDTFAVPQDGQYHVVEASKVVFSSPNLEEARHWFKEREKEIRPSTNNNNDNRPKKSADIDNWLDRKAAYWSNSGSFRGGGRLRNR